MRLRITLLPAILLAVALVACGESMATQEPTITLSSESTAARTQSAEPTGTLTPMPTSTPEPEPTVTSDGADFEAEAAYFTWASEISKEYGTAWEKMGTLMGRPDALIGEQWKIDVAVTAATILILGDEVSQHSDVPSRVSDIHARFIAASEYYSESIPVMMEGFDTLNVDKINAATLLIQSGTAEIDEATRLTNAYID